MNLQIVEAQAGDRDVVGRLLQLYAYDFSEYIDNDTDDEGFFGSITLGDWPSESRRVFLFRVDGKLAGFASIDAGSQIGGGADVTDMGEFFVMRRYRRRGVGAEAARRLFDIYPGRWEVRELATNLPAQAFWRRVIGEYTGGDYEESALDDERWRGPVQAFVAKARVPGG